MEQDQKARPILEVALRTDEEKAGREAAETTTTKMEATMGIKKVGEEKANPREASPGMTKAEVRRTAPQELTDLRKLCLPEQEWEGRSHHPLVSSLRRAIQTRLP